MTRDRVAASSYERLVWLTAFLQAYIVAVGKLAEIPHHEPISGEVPNWEARSEREFEAFVADYAKSPFFHNACTLFRLILGRPLRQSFKEHAWLLTVRYGTRSNAP